MDATLTPGRSSASEASRTAPAADRRLTSAAGRWFVLVYGTLAYLAFLATFLYAIGFVAGVAVPKGIDDGAPAPLLEALLVNGGFLGLFAIQHAVMARRGFKRRWTRIVPPAIERSTFVLATCAILAPMFWLWRPLPGVVWHVEGPAAAALLALCALGWGTVLLSSFLIDHFHLFGVRQVVEHFRRAAPPSPTFRERSLYKLVRHPLMLGFLLAFWSTPHMTWGHLLFAGLCTGYILVGTRMEERDLIAEHGAAYLDYKRRVPYLIPLPRRAS